MSSKSKKKYNYKPLTLATKAKIIELFSFAKDNRTTVIAAEVNEPFSRVNDVINRYIKDVSKYNQPDVSGQRYITLKSKMN